MSLPDTAIINFSSVSDRKAQRAIRAVNRQVTEDFTPIWGAGYISKLHGSRFDPAEAEILIEDPVAAEAVLYLVDQPNLAGALGYHSINNFEVPVGFVFTDLGEWTVTLSHEVLELIMDPTVNILVPGPHPNDPNGVVLHAYEVCDAVERTVYDIDGIPVSNFVTPQYFREGDAAGTRNDFLGVGVASFGLTPDSHIAFFDLATGRWDVVIGAAEMPACHVNQKFEQWASKEERPPNQKILEQCRSTWRAFNDSPPKRAKALHKLGGVVRRDRYEALAMRYRDMFTGKYRKPASTQSKTD